MKSFTDIRRMIEDAGANSCGGGGIAGINSDPEVVVRKRPKIIKRKLKEKVNLQRFVAAAADPESPLKVNRKAKFAGMKLFDVSGDEYSRVSGNPRQKGDRASRHLNSVNQSNRYMRNWSYHNKKKPLVVRNYRTGEITFFRGGLRGDT